MALGFLTTGFGAGGLLVPASVWLIDQYGWRTAVIVFGAGMWLLGIPLASLVREPDGTECSLENKETSLKTNQRLEGLTAKEALRTKDFWLLSMAILFGGIAGTAIIVHQIPYMVSVGISRQAAGFITVAFAISNITGRLVSGWLGDLFDKRRIFAIAASINSAGILAFALATSVVQFVPSLIVLGIGFGGLIPLRPALQGEFFGIKAFGTIQGFLMVFITLGSVISPPFVGWMFDSVGSYRSAFLILAMFALVAVPAILAVPKKALASFDTP